MPIAGYNGPMRRTALRSLGLILGLVLGAACSAASTERPEAGAVVDAMRPSADGGASGGDRGIIELDGSAGAVDGSPPAGDGSALDDALTADAAPASRRIEVGTGSMAFRSVASGEVMPFTMGIQGGGRYEGFHVWFAARTRDLDPQGLQSTFSLLHSPSGQVFGTTTIRTDYQASGDDFVVYGVAPRISDCCAARRSPLIMRVEVVAANGMRASDDRDVIGAADCSDGEGNSLCE